MLALQIVAGTLLVLGSLALVSFLRWLDAQEPQPLAPSPALDRRTAARSRTAKPATPLRRAA